MSRKAVVAHAPLSPAGRWALVGERLRKEARATDIETKLVQTASLMASVDDFGWRKALGREDEQVRALWTRLRAKMSGG